MAFERVDAPLNEVSYNFVSIHYGKDAHLVLYSKSNQSKEGRKEAMAKKEQKTNYLVPDNLRHRLHFSDEQIMGKSVVMDSVAKATVGP